MHKIFIGLFILVIYKPAFAQIPKLGTDSTLEIATWNVCWLGDSTQGNGPSDEALQYNNVKQFLQQSDLDIIAIEELSNPNTYYQLNKDLSSYSSMISDMNQVQKMALYWKNSHFKIIHSYSNSILIDQEYNFARAPLQVCLQLNNPNKDTIFFIVLHMKAYGDQASYNRRVNASLGLKAYLETTLKDKKYVVLGDWNDDLNVSTFQKSTSPYQNLVSAGYHFPSKELTDMGKRSYAYSKVVFDHILHSQYLQDSLYIPNSTSVFDLAPNYILNYSKTTSDHYPVFAKYQFKLPNNKPTGIAIENSKTEFEIYPNPSTDWLRISPDEQNVAYQIFSINGNLVQQGIGVDVNINNLESGMYMIYRKGFKSSKFIKLTH